MRGGHETILLVEDDTRVRKSVCALLKRLGYQVLEAANGPEALEQWQANRDRVNLLYTTLLCPRA